MDFFESAYTGTPPWDIGRPQAEFVALEEGGEISGSVLDIGCGTGEHTLFLSSRGHEAWGIDAVPAAIEKAKEKAAERNVPARFMVFDALRLSALGRQFDTAIDSGFFHTLSDTDRPVFASELGKTLRPGGKYFMLCFSENEPPGYGPRRVTRQEIQDTFQEGWVINSIKPAVFESRYRKEGPRAWLSSISKN